MNSFLRMCQAFQDIDPGKAKHYQGNNGNKYFFFCKSLTANWNISKFILTQDSQVGSYTEIKAIMDNVFSGSNLSQTCILFAPTIGYLNAIICYYYHLQTRSSSQLAISNKVW